MIRKLCFTFAVISAASLSMVSAQQTAKVTASGIGYLEYLPQGYHSSSKKYPVVISLHGIKEKGTASTNRQAVLADLDKVDNVGLPRYVKQGRKYPFILISPQLKKNQGMWQPSYVISVLNHVKKQLRIDNRRIYLTGLSLGGFGVWRTAGAYPDVFAAIAPICSGGNDLKNADRIAAHDLPIWGFHGNKDKVVSHNVTVKMINAINSRKPNPLAKTTIFQGMGHSVWDRAYQDTKLLDWLLSQRKGSSSSSGSDDDDGSDKQQDDKDQKDSSNKPPIVKAGPDRTLTLPDNSLQIAGDADDRDGKITSYKWTQVSGRKASMKGINQRTLKVQNLKEGAYVFRLTARDNDGAAKSDHVRITVKKSKGSKPGKDNDKDKDKDKGNARPVADAGPDIKIKNTGATVKLVGSGKDRDGKIVSYHWRKIAGPGVHIRNAGSSTATLTNLKEGRYYFALTVKDNNNAVHVDKMALRVYRK